MFTKLARKQEGFTLIELLVVVAIIALLAAFAVPRLFSAMESARKAPGTADMQTIADSMERYFVDPTHRKYPAPADTDNTDALKATAVKNALLGTYLKNGTTFKNGYKKGFVYLTNYSGKYFFLIDQRNFTATGSYKVVCGNGNTGQAPTGSTVFDADGKVTQWVSPDITFGTDFKVIVQSTTATDPTPTVLGNEATAIPSSSAMKDGCHVAQLTGSGSSATWTEFSGGTPGATDGTDSVQLITF